MVTENYMPSAILLLSQLLLSQLIRDYSAAIVVSICIEEIE